MSQIPSISAAQFRRKLRQVGLPQRQFAKEIQMDVGTINRWATGKLEVPHWVSLLLDLMIETKKHKANC